MAFELPSIGTAVTGADPGGSGLGDMGNSFRSAGMGQAVGKVTNWLAGADPTKKQNYGSPYSPNQDTQNRIEGMAQGPVAPGQMQVPDARAAMIAMGPQDQSRAYQVQLANQLARQAAGQGPSLAVNALRQGQSANIAGLMAMQASQRGQPSALGLRNAQNQAADINAQMAMQAANARLAEQQAAQSSLAGLTNQMRSSDIGLATSQAQLQNNVNLQNAQQASQRAMAYQDLVGKYAAMGLDAQKANQMAALEMEKMQQSASIAQMGANQAEAARRSQMIGSLFGGGAGALGNIFQGAGKNVLSSGATTTGPGAGAGAGAMAGGDAADIGSAAVTA